MHEKVRINSADVKYTEKHIESRYCYHTASVRRDGDAFTVTPSSTEFIFRTERKVPRLGVMLVGWGGNNGTTVTAAVLANKLGLTWKTKTGLK
ncbi:inositol-3-phosphate synthase 1-A-like, partial [Sinocyclocheilus grahami]|uniref:inositol-3-phosphate synthase 1-A-like n=1 Tax=Sinocyclocheilus grahami TaxID=75366 RepID=UPI0007AC860E